MVCEDYGKLQGRYVIYFCSKGCEEKFEKNPKKFLSKMKQREEKIHKHHH